MPLCAPAICARDTTLEAGLYEIFVRAAGGDKPGAGAKSPRAPHPAIQRRSAVSRISLDQFTKLLVESRVVDVCTRVNFAGCSPTSLADVETAFNCAVAEISWKHRTLQFLGFRCALRHLGIRLMPTVAPSVAENLICIGLLRAHPRQMLDSLGVARTTHVRLSEDALVARSKYGQPSARGVALTRAGHNLDMLSERH